MRKRKEAALALLLTLTLAVQLPAGALAADASDEAKGSFAQALETRINREAPGLCKPVLVKDGRYNQNIGVFSVLLEVGHNQNTLSQACNSVAPIARALYSLLVESPDPKLMRMQTEWQASHPLPAGRDNVDVFEQADKVNLSIP